MATNDGLCVPGPFPGGKDLAKSWADWEEGFNYYLIASGKVGKTGSVKVAILLNQLGSEGRTIYKSLQLSETDKNNIDVVLKGFRDYYTPKRNTTFESYKFFTRKQLPNERFDNFYTDLRNQLQLCAYPNTATDENNVCTLRDRLLRDQIVLGVNSDAIRSELLYANDLTLEKAVSICRSKESAFEISACLQNDSTSNENTLVHQVKSNRATSKQQNTNWTNKPIKIKQCKYCGKDHMSGQCPAYGKQCRICTKMNHFANVCSQNKPEAKSYRKAHALIAESDDDDDEQDTRFTFAIQTDTNVYSNEANDQTKTQSFTVSHGKTWYEILELKNGKTLKCKADTGAEVNVLPAEVCFNLYPNSKLQKCSLRLEAYGGRKLKVLGQITLQVTHANKYHLVTFVVVKEGNVPLLGLHTLREELKLIRVDTVTSMNGQIDMVEVKQYEQILNNYDDVFKGDGKLPGTHQIRLKSDYVPVVHAARRVPFRLRRALKETLDDMESREMITRVTVPTEYVNPIVIVPKPNHTLRICLDPLDLNKAILREHYQVPTADEIYMSVNGSTVFSTLDARTGFMQIQLDDESSHLCTFATPFGRYRFKRLPYGITSAPEVFHRTVAEHLKDLEGVALYIDDILIHGKDQSEHDARLRAVLQRCRDINLKLNRSKCKFSVHELKYLGHIIGAKGLKVDPDRVAAIQKMPMPTNKDELQRFLGVITYLSKFCPNLAEVSSCLRSLMKKNSEFIWDIMHTNAYNTIINMITTAPTLKIFDTKEPVIISVDASQSGMGAVLMQKEQPIEYTSCTLTDTQRRYAQIEKEMLAVEFGLTRFHRYIYGQEVIVETDHKPLIGMMKKPISEVSPRLANMRLKCLPYEAKLVYKPGKELVLADTLSRAYLPQYVKDNIENEIIRICDVVTPNTKSDMRTDTANDMTLQTLIKYIQNGWPNSKHQLPNAVKPYWTVKDDLMEYDGLVFRSNQVVVPSSLISKALSEIHTGHMGITKCLERAKTAVFWPGYTHQIKDMIESCDICQQHRNQNQTETLLHYPIPSYPHEFVASDLFELHQKHYLMTVDMYSKWPCAVELKSLQSTAVITELDRIFTDFGTPEKLISDNGPQYGCAEFRKYCQQKHITHITSSPQYAQSNGLAERHVQNIKIHLKKMLLDGKGLQDTLAAIRSTPIGDGLPSPAVLLQGRNIRTPLHQSKQLHPKLIPPNIVRTILAKKQGNASWYHQGNKQYTILWPGQPVRFRHGGLWIPGTIINHADLPHSYYIETAHGSTIRRNRTQINVDKGKVVSDSEDLPMTRLPPTQATVTNTLPHPSSTMSTSEIPQTTPAFSTYDNDNTTIISDNRTRSGRAVIPPNRLDI